MEDTPGKSKDCELGIVEATVSYASLRAYTHSSRGIYMAPTDFTVAGPSSHIPVCSCRRAAGTDRGRPRDHMRDHGGGVRR